MPTVGIEGGVSRDHLVNVAQGARFNVPGGPGLYATLASLFTLRWLEKEDARDNRHPSRVRVFGEGADDDIVGLLTRNGADADWLPQHQTAPALWILTTPSGRRILRADRSGQHELGSEDIDDYGPDLPTPPHFVDGLDALLRCAPRDPAAISPDTHTVVAVDPDQREIADRGWSYLEELAETATIFLPSRVQLSQLGEDPLSVARTLRDRTHRSVIARLDASGSYVLPNTGDEWHVASVPTSVVDTTGAGDSHAAALVTAFVSRAGHNDLVRCAAIASVIGGLVVGAWGPDALLNTDIAELGKIDDAIAQITTTQLN